MLCVVSGGLGGTPLVVARGGKGSNQYQTRGYSASEVEQAVSAWPDLMGQLESAIVKGGRVRCGEINGTDCVAWVEPPRYSHGTHQSQFSPKLLASGAAAQAGMLGHLASNPDSTVRSLVADNKHTPRSVLERLAQDTERVVRGAVAGNPATPGPTLEDLASDPDDGVRGVVAGNPKAPGRALEELASDSDSGVRISVATNANTPPKVLEILADDDYVVINVFVARNRATPAAALARLAVDRDDMVSNEALDNPSLPDHLRILAELAKNQRPD